MKCVMGFCGAVSRGVMVQFGCSAVPGLHIPSVTEVQESRADGAASESKGRSSGYQDARSFSAHALREDSVSCRKGFG